MFPRLLLTLSFLIVLSACSGSGSSGSAPVVEPPTEIPTDPSPTDPAPVRWRAAAQRLSVLTGVSAWRAPIRGGAFLARTSAPALGGRAHDGTPLTGPSSTAYSDR